ncbi:glycosyltransferase family 4 protein [Lachnoclostridium sp. Marseille-P6806]|uniref:glycosyltransferase family 4 protein n=1 Tax=Lachnoclostridium sp. Marseille-P6806 TaxID=2364793 RepID=UPI00103234F4|nr:glycosyltransferase family 4 protein [Lachnoclostridium sp. Marseille-P6806]
MRILWLCNIMLPAFAKAEGLPYSCREGWLSGSFERLRREQKVYRENGEQDALLNIDLGVCFPVPETLGDCRRELEGVVFYGFQENLEHPEVYDRSLELRFAGILADFRPDIVHIFGTEFPHTLAMVRAFRNPTRTLIGIQGMCGSIAERYMADLPYRVQRGATFRDRVRRDSLREQQHKFRVRARMEEQALAHTAHITGRTGFDRAAAGEINPDAVYHMMNETLRNDFYSGEWDPAHIEPHSIFLSQGDYPLKGFHYMLEAMPSILRAFPDAKLYVSGNSIIGGVGGRLREKKRVPLPLRITAYGRYLRKLIRKNRLGGHVIMLGRLDAQQMKEQFLRSHVFVCASIMENSPNSLCEAMLLGVPCVAAKVGGVPDLLSDGEDGILFPGGKYDELAEGVKALFYDDELARTLGTHARRTAQVTHNPDTNFKRLLSIYRSIMGTPARG